MSDLTPEQSQRLTTLTQVSTSLDLGIEDLIAAADWVLYGTDLARLLRLAVDGDENARAQVRRFAGLDDDDIGSVDPGAEARFRHEHDDTISIPAVSHA